MSGGTGREDAGISSGALRLSFAINRTDAGVVVTVHGVLDHRGVGMLTLVLRDLIDDQGNGTVVVDLGDVGGAGPAAVELFSTASRWCRRHGTSLRLYRPPAPLGDVLGARLGEEIDIVP